MLTFFAGQTPAAQSFAFALLERYLEAMREQAGIPGLAAGIVQNGELVWSPGFGVARVDDDTIRVDADTPFPVADLSQTIGATLALRYCIDHGEATLDDRVVRWSPDFAEPQTTFRQLLAHTGPTGYRYDPARFAALTRAIEECARQPYPLLVAQQVFGRFVMPNSVPGGDVVVAGSRGWLLFSPPARSTYGETLRRAAAPHRVVRPRRGIRTSYQVPSLTAAQGLVTTVRDLAEFDAALDDGTLVSRGLLRDEAWRRWSAAPTGLGWFVQEVNRRHVVWHFGLVDNAYSSLMIKLPDQGLTLILLANSDGLHSPFAIEDGDVMVSPFARIFFALLG